MSDNTGNAEKAEKAERESLVARWRNTIAERLNPAGPIAANHDTELAQFHERLDRLRDLAETTSDPLRSGSYEQLWRTMGEELGFVANDLDRGQLSAADLPHVYRRWLEMGRSYADSYIDNGQDQATARQILGTDLTNDTASAPGSDPAIGAEDSAAPQAHRVDLGGGAVLVLSESDYAAYNSHADDTATDAVMKRVDELVTSGDYDEFNAARLEDADNPAGAARLRADAAQARREAARLAREAGLDLFDEEHDGDAAGETGELNTVNDGGDDGADKGADEAEDRIADLMSRAEGGDESAEELEYADNPAGADLWREEAQRLRAEADELVRAAGVGGIGDEDSDPGGVLEADTADTAVTGAGDGEQAHGRTVGNGDHDGRAVKATAVESADRAESARNAAQEPVVLADATETADALDEDDSGQVSAAVEASACATAISRASVTVDDAARAVNDAAKVAADKIRADQVAAWQATDRADRADTAYTAATAAGSVRREIESQNSNTTTGLGDDSLTW